ncbi:MAG: serine hydrolase domain-containing protein [Pseudomonadota bacterium]
MLLWFARLAVVLLSLLGVSLAVAANAPLRGDVETILAEERLTGITWALVDSTRGVRTGVAGLRDAADAVPFAAETRVHVGSLTKAVLATGLLQLATQGRISLDAPAIRYLPESFTTEAPADFGATTVRHLLDHTAGLNDADLWQLFSERVAPDTPLRAAFPDPGKQLRPRSKPGTQFSYSNSGYALLGMIIEAVTGERYESYLDRELLGALGMHDSSFAFTSQEGSYRDPALAWGHVDDGSRYAAAPMFLRPSGQFTTTAADLGHFAAFLMGDGQVGDARIVDEKLMRARGKASSTDAGRAGLAAGYALGLGRRDRHGVVGYCHGGNTIGFAAMLCVFPDERKAFAYSVNTDSESADYGRLDRRFISELDIPMAKAPTTVRAAADVDHWSGSYVLSPNRFQQFAYLDRLFGSLRISAHEGHLTLTSLQRERRQLRPSAEYRFTANDRRTESHVLLRDASGAYFLSDGFQSYRRLSTVYLAAHWLSLALGLAGLVWILIAGSFLLLRWRSLAPRHACFPAYLALLSLLIPIPLFLRQSFLALGDPKIASDCLAGVSLAVPLGMVLSLRRFGQQPRLSRLDLLWTAAAAGLLQWCAVLAVNGMLPLRLWA